jgi:hypothetical protein
MFRSFSAALAMSGLFVLPLTAQTTTQTATTTNTTTTAKAATTTPIANFDAFLDAHPPIEKDLEKNPSLLKDSAYLAAHPELKTFLADHPNVAAQASNNPKELMKRLNKFERSGRDIPKADLAAFDKFMDQHEALEKQVRKDPTLLTNADFLAKNPDLKNFLAAHPNMQQEINEHPRVFMRAENRFEHGGADRREDRIERQQAKLEHRAATPPPPHPVGPRR